MKHSDIKRQLTDEAMRAWFDDVCRRIDGGTQVVFAPMGMSMWPSIRPSTDSVYVTRRSGYRAGDMVLAWSDRPAGVYLHRVYRRAPGGYLLMGDSNTSQQEYCRREDVAGCVVAIDRAGRRFSPSRLTALPFLLPCGVRRYIVGILRRFMKNPPVR